MTFEIFFLCQAEEAMAGVAAMNMSMSNMSTAAEVTEKEKKNLTCQCPGIFAMSSHYGAAC